MEPAAKIAPQPWMTAPETNKVVAALSAEGACVRFVGGCVRDAVLGRDGSDVDIATPDTPETVTRLLEAAAIKAVPTGIKHGTVTAVVGGAHFEVTTLRRDIETDGRHATVAFTDDWAADAARRDFTINALFCDPDGTLYDHPTMFHMTTAAPTIHWPNSFPHAAFAQPVSETVQWMSSGVRSCQNRAVISWPRA